MYAVCPKLHQTAPQQEAIPGIFLYFSDLFLPNTIVVGQENAQDEAHFVGNAPDAHQVDKQVYIFA